jgi:hypothetical protein
VGLHCETFAFELELIEAVVLLLLAGHISLST